MKILQINKFFFLKGGSERHFFDLSELLSEKNTESLFGVLNIHVIFLFPIKKILFNLLISQKVFGKELKKQKKFFGIRKQKKN